MFTFKNKKGLKLSKFLFYKARNRANQTQKKYKKGNYKNQYRKQKVGETVEKKLLSPKSGS